MVKRNIKLKGLTTGPKLKTFMIESDSQTAMYFSDTEDISYINTSKNNNLGCMYDKKNNHFIHNLYPMSRVEILTTAKTSTNKLTIEDFLKLYVPNFKDSDIVDVQLVGSFTYVLTKPTSNGFKFIYEDGTSIQDGLKTYLYNPAISTSLSNDTPYTNMLCCQLSGIDNCQNVTLLNILNDTFSIKDFLYNYLIEIPNDYIFNFYDSTSILGDGINTKRHLNYDYVMDMSLDNANHYIKISKVRDYSGLSRCGDTTFLRYNCPYSYVISSIVSNDQIIPITSDLSTYATYNQKYPVVYELSIGHEDKVNANDMYQLFDKVYNKVETIESVNRFTSVEHKSNMYSIDVVDSGITYLSSDSEALMIKDDIDNNLRYILKTITPVNTLFIGIRWTGS